MTTFRMTAAVATLLVAGFSAQNAQAQTTWFSQLFNGQLFNGNASNTCTPSTCFPAQYPNSTQYPNMNAPAYGTNTPYQVNQPGRTLVPNWNNSPLNNNYNNYYYPPNNNPLPYQSVPAVRTRSVVPASSPPQYYNGNFPNNYYNSWNGARDSQGLLLY